MTEFRSHVQRAVKIVGGQVKLAALIGRTQSEVWRLCNTAQSMPPKVAVAISKATNGAVSVSELLPDVAAAVRAELEREPAPATEGAAA